MSDKRPTIPPQFLLLTTSPPPFTSPTAGEARVKGWGEDEKRVNRSEPAPTGFFILILFTFLSHITTNKKERELMWKGT